MIRFPGYRRPRGHCSAQYLRQRSAWIALALLLPLLSIAAAHAAQTPAGAQPSAGCSHCHAAQSRTQPDTMMGRALELAGDNPILSAHPLLAVTKGSFTYTVATRGGRSTYTVSDGVSTISVPILWSFGAGNQTWVLERDGKFYESLVSYYVSIDGLDTTTGDATIAPATLEQAFGRELDAADQRACFGCHSTGSLVDGRLQLGALHPGVACTRCHTGSLDHQAAMDRGDFSVYPPNLRRFDAEDLSALCGQCHRTWELVVRSGWRGTVNVRFQPYRLALSRCFIGSDPRISCIACHDPHQPLVRDLAFYDAKCLACHAVAPRSSAAHSAAHPARAPLAAAASADASASAPASATQPESCPVATSKCVTCHMPRTRMLEGHLVFTDHDIRIVHPGDAYPN